VESAVTGRRRPGVFRIGAIAERFGIHPQTLRLYEREGLLRPVRTEGNTRLYDSDTIERLEIILTLTRDLGVNLAGVEVILHMKEKIERMQGDVHHLLAVLKEDVEARRVEPDRRYALTTVSKSLALAKLEKR
jgi:MerR family transcriptional regulator/heat shock protein HspR